MAKKFSVLIFIVFLILSGAGLFADSEVSIYYTASLNGNLIGCNCHGGPTAGLSTTAAYLREIDPDNSILIDLGDFNYAKPDELLSDIIVRLYSELGYDIVAIGDQELVSGIKYFKTILKKLNIISNNIKINRRPVSKKPQIIERNGIKIGFAAVIAPDVFSPLPDDVKSRIKAGDPDAAASNALEILNQKGSSYNILLFHGNIDEAKKLYLEQVGWDAVLSAHDQMLVEQSDGNRVFASPGEDGNRVGQLRLSFRDNQLSSVSNDIRYFKYEEEPEDPEVLQAFEDYKTELINNLKNGKR